jgi:surfeit locus 1 family protein
MTRHLVLFSLFMAAGLALLIGLGVWQLQRLEWKEGLIAKIEARVHAPPVILKEAVARARAGEDISYLRVKTAGRFDHSKERHVYAVTDEGVGWHVITPLATPDGEVVLIDRGIVPDQLKDPATRPQGEIEGTVTVAGLARQPESQGRFTPDNEPEQNRWFWRDLGGLTRSMFPGAQPEVAPFIVEAEKSDVPGGWPRGGATRLDIPNDHFQYAITWFLLAFCLVVVYAVYVRSRLRPPATPVAGPGADR